MRATHLVLAAFLSATSTYAATDTVEIPELELAITLPALTDVTTGVPDEDKDTPLVRWWDAKLGDKSLGISIAAFDSRAWALREPGDVTEVALDNQSGRRRFSVIEQFYVPGDLGYAPFAAVAVADVTLPDRTAATERHFLLGGLLESQGYVIHLACDPMPTPEEEEQIRTFLHEGITYLGSAERDADWTDDEVLERWKASTPEDFHEDFEKALKRKSTAKKVRVRTKHYLIMTNSSGGKLFAKKMEENYDEIVDLYPFADVKGRRLMPVFLFRTRDEYMQFHMFSTGSTPDQARRSGGFAWKDYYATWYEAPKDPVHIHEQTHQIFGNRLRLRGGGSWFQEGVAEYIETRANDRNVVARLVSKGEATPLRDLVQLRSLLHSTKEYVSGGSRAGDNYKQAALLIEFLRESKFGKEGFEEFLYTLGKVRRGDVEAIDAGFRQVYGIGIEEVETKWRAYCEDR